ncbi:hypothetical protein BG011_009093 [Mortierella polycephala]|uniref:Uncharacterized protein n=1 Tax=Mortierella polycephala TaxID=41804 RepID=A0A9P6PNX4_9FUNG|nr:hypothetical protein BG011_009093 [Mortierella polycephala]
MEQKGEETYDDLSDGLRKGIALHPRTVPIMLIESPTLDRSINAELVKECGYHDNDFTVHECQVVANLDNISDHMRQCDKDA